MEIDDSADSDCELVIDETVIANTNQNDFESNENISEKKKLVTLADVPERKWNIFHPLSISSADIKEELFHEETNTCSICNESFRYNVGLIYHLEMEHVELKVTAKRSHKRKNPTIKNTTKKTKNESAFVDNQKTTKKDHNKELVKRISQLNEVDLKNGESVFRRSCHVCKKIFFDQIKLTKHMENCVSKFQCVYCKSKFGWESKYKKHLFKTHKLNAAVICKLCSNVYPDMTALALHTRKCNKSCNIVVDVDEISIVEEKQET